MPYIALIVIIDINISLLFFCKSALFFCLIRPISECRAQKTLTLSCLFDNKAVFTEFKLLMAIIFACLSEFTLELEKECLTLPVLLIEQVHSNLDLTYSWLIVKWGPFRITYNISLTIFLCGQ